MIHYSKVAAGLRKYADEEITAKLGGSLKAWCLGACVEILCERMNAVMEIPILRSMSIVEGEMVDAEALLNALKIQADKGTATVEIPMIGIWTFNRNDIDKFAQYIMQ